MYSSMLFFLLKYRIYFSISVDISMDMYDIVSMNSKEKGADKMTKREMAEKMEEARTIIMEVYNAIGNAKGSDEVSTAYCRVDDAVGFLKRADHTKQA